MSVGPAPYLVLVTSRRTASVQHLLSRLSSVSGLFAHESLLHNCAIKLAAICLGNECIVYTIERVIENGLCRGWSSYFLVDGNV